MTGHLRSVCATLLPLVLLLTLPTVVKAQFTVTTNNGAITITGYTGSGGAVTIPRTISGLPVRIIGDWAFYERTSLTSIDFPDSVVSIGSYSFAACSSLTNVTIPNGVSSIGEEAFAGCGFSTVTIPNSITSIQDFTFEGCPNLTSVTIPDSVTYIGNYAFAYDSSLSSVIIGSGVNSIGIYSFYVCPSSLLN